MFNLDFDYEKTVKSMTQERITTEEIYKSNSNELISDPHKAVE